MVYKEQSRDMPASSAAVEYFIMKGFANYLMKRKKKNITIRDIADIAGVSPAAVSLALNDKKGVSDKTREHIKKIVAAYNYSPQKDAKKTKKRNIRFVKFSKHGMAVEENQGFIASIIDHIESECKRSFFNLLMCGCNNTTVEETFKTVAKDPMDGVIVLGTEFDDIHFELIPDIKAPVIVIDNSAKNKNFDSVVMANEEIAAAAVSYLYELGHRKIGYYQTSVALSNFTERYEGYLDALAKLKLEPPKPVLLTPTLKGAYADMKRYLESGEYVPGGAVVAGNDTIAIGAMKALLEAGYRIPDDVSIIGVDDIPYSSVTVPSLTTMRISRSAMGILTIDLLRKRLKYPDWPHIRIQVKGQLIERASTAPAK